MSAYVIATVEVQDKAFYAQYAAGFMAMFGAYKGRVIVADDAPAVIEGEWPLKRTVIIEFADKAEALRWYHSEEYQVAAQFRHRGARTSIVLVRGAKFP